MNGLNRQAKWPLCSIAQECVGLYGRPISEEPRTYLHRLSASEPCDASDTTPGIGTWPAPISPASEMV
jgi:hypothetical protein